MTFPEPSDKVLRWLAAGCASAILVALGSGQLQGGQPAAGPTPVGNAVVSARLEERMAGVERTLAERLEGNNQLLESRFAAMQDQMDQFQAAVTQMAENAGEIRAGVREQGFNFAAWQAQMQARIEADKAQDARIEALVHAIELLRGGGPQ